MKLLKYIHFQWQLPPNIEPFCKISTRFPGVRIVDRIGVRQGTIGGELATTTYTSAFDGMAYLLCSELNRSVPELERSVVCLVLWFRYPTTVVQELLKLRLG
jgi:hypothetical protein